MLSIGFAGGFSVKERSRLDLVVGQANRVQKSLEFKTSILAHKVPGAKLTYVGFHGTTDTNLEVYKKLVTIDAPITVYLETPSWWKRRWTSELARENTDGSITINRDYFARAPISDLVDTLIHELSHRAGYSHDYRWSYLRDFTVPYAVGRIAGKLAGGMVLTPLAETGKVAAPV